MSNNEIERREFWDYIDKSLNRMEKEMKYRYPSLRDIKPVVKIKEDSSVPKWVVMILLTFALLLCGLMFLLCNTHL